MIVVLTLLYVGLLFLLVRVGVIKLNTFCVGWPCGINFEEKTHDHKREKTCGPKYGRDSMSRIIGLSSVSALFAALLLGATGCAGTKESPVEQEKQAFADVRATIQSVIPDSEREVKALALVSAVEHSFFDVRKNIKAREARFRELNADYDATRADIESELDRIKMDIKSNQQTVTDIHRQLVDVMTADEWAAVEKAESKALSAAVRSLQSI